MLDYLKDVGDDYDALSFVPTEDDKIVVQSSRYVNRGEPVESTEIGNKWHVILFRIDEEDGPKDIDHFEGIFSDPREYISGLIPSGWYGMVAKKTTTSKAFVDDMLARVKEVL